jgi:hypothetical protein
MQVPEKREEWYSTNMYTIATLFLVASIFDIYVYCKIFQHLIK